MSEDGAKLLLEAIEAGEPIPRMVYLGHKIISSCEGFRNACWQCNDCKHIWKGEQGEICPKCFRFYNRELIAFWSGRYGFNSPVSCDANGIKQLLSNLYQGFCPADCPDDSSIGNNQCDYFRKMLKAVKCYKKENQPLPDLIYMKRTLKELAQEAIDVQSDKYNDLVELTTRFNRALVELRSYSFLFNHPIIHLWIHKLTKVASQISSYENDLAKCKEIVNRGY